MRVPDAKRPVLIIFAKRPQVGRVKTRLGATIGLTEAAGVYARLLYGLLLRMLALRPQIEIRLCLASVDDMPFFQAAFPELTVCAQCPGDIGQRMKASLHDALASGAPKAILIGSDAPDIDAATIEQALASLDGAPVVLGPATDGGYYLVGAIAPLPDLFTGIPWSTQDVLSETIALADCQGVEVSLLPEMSDIDTEKDLAAWQLELRQENTDV